MSRKIEYTATQVTAEDGYRCDCCNEPVDNIIYRFNGSEIDDRYEGEHVCKECAEILSHVDRVAAMYEQVRNFKYLELITREGRKMCGQ